ncbi:uncharacterized protein C2orf16-like [Pecten maximus]|uniref:uncharacterized protein C2orf16-like n=1 Tax=Pecten maximus TaxID=6579 RepID=UPI0014587067|nr:uncharacterized protein C2orf16-like [Pecten maximus]XP_033729995.1 uncharacterized protein C2orf16-like [Pecten maximus]
MVPNRQTHRIPSRQTRRIPSRQTRRIPSRQTRRIPSRQTHRIPRRQTHRIPSRQTHRIPTKETGRIPTKETRRIPSRQTHRIPSRQTHRIPSRQTRRIPSRQTRRIPSRQTHRIPSRQTHRIPSRQTHRIPTKETRRIPTKETRRIPTSHSSTSKESQPLSQPRRSVPNQPSSQPSTITDYFNDIDDKKKKLLIERCVEMNIPIPRNQNSQVYLSRDSPTLSFIRECQLKYEDVECSKLYTIWYMSSRTETQVVKSEYTLQLAASVLTWSFHERTDIATVLETIEPIPFSKTAPLPTTIPSYNVHVGNVSLSPNDLRTLRPMAWLNDQFQR